ncbi:MAG: DNA repair protein RadC [Treponema sp.]|nr:DNA repair protein RadC [Treponema sp.]
MECLESDYTTKRSHPDIRELTLKNGISYPSDSELLMLMLGSGIQNMPIQELSKKVMSVMNLSNQDNLIKNLKDIKGMGTSKTLAVAAALELGRRRNAYLKAVINKPHDIIPYIQHYAMENKEHFICTSLNGAHEILKIRVISIGTIDKTLIHPREIFSDPIAEHASAVICSHNHPYGACMPSKADIESTKAIKNAADILGIAFLDHIILTKSDYFSFLEHEML